MAGIGDEISPHLLDAALARAIVDQDIYRVARCGGAGRNHRDASRSRGTGTASTMLFRNGCAISALASASATRNSGCRSKKAVSVPKAEAALAFRQMTAPVSSSLQQGIGQALEPAPGRRRKRLLAAARLRASCSARIRLMASWPSECMPGHQQGRLMRGTLSPSARKPRTSRDMMAISRPSSPPKGQRHAGADAPSRSGPAASPAGAEADQAG